MQSLLFALLHALASVLVSVAGVVELVAGAVDGGAEDHLGLFLGDFLFLFNLHFYGRFYLRRAVHLLGRDGTVALTGLAFAFAEDGARLALLELLGRHRAALFDGVTLTFNDFFEALDASADLVLVFVALRIQLPDLLGLRLDHVTELLNQH